MEIRGKEVRGGVLRDRTGKYTGVKELVLATWRWSWIEVALQRGGRGCVLGQVLAGELLKCRLECV